MSEHNWPGGQTLPELETPSPDQKDALTFPLDLIVLRSMAKKLSVTLRTLEFSSDPEFPLSYSFKERHGRTHRMIIFLPNALLALDEMRFVGFVSRRSQTVDARVSAEILRVDQQMLGEIAHIPGLLSYSSLELRPGYWYNLVVFRDSGVKQQVQETETHRYAAYQLSPAYYEWIHLHNGVISGGLRRPELRLQTTRCYHFAGAHKLPTVRTLSYEECTGV